MEIPERENIEILFEHNTLGLFGENGVEGAHLVKRKGESDEELVDIQIDGFFLAIGHTPNTAIFKEWLDTDEVGYLKNINGTPATKIPGVFVAGDCADPVFRQAIVAAGSGCQATEELSEADAVFLNTCSVRDNAEQKIYHRLDALAAERKRKQKTLIIGVLGCMAERAQQDLLDNHHCDLVAGPDAYLSLPDLVAQAELGHKAMNIELSTTETYRDVVPQRIGLGHKIGGFVSIMRGCNNFCHYCIVPYTRGRERSRDIESILTEVRDLRDKGYKEVTLLGQNVNSYRLENLGNLGSLDFPALLRKVAEEAPTMRIRFTTSHPKDMSDETLRVIAEMPNVCKHIHLPVQSGSDRILKLMNRKYTREWYLDRVAAHHP